jgi:hypothetical protein
MSRTPIPQHLIHHPEEVDRNGKRFDDLCRLAEEVAFPIVQEALFREYKETTASGAQILTEEAKQALENLAEDAAILEDLDEEKVIADLQKSLGQAVPPPDDEECRQHTRDFSQLLVSTWLETIRTAHANVQILKLSEFLIPIEPWTVGNIVHRLVPKPKIPETITDALGLLAPNQEDIMKVLSILREKLFAQPQLVALPFGLAMVGAPAIANSPAQVMVMKHDLFITLLTEVENQQRQKWEREERERARVREALLASAVLDLSQRDERWQALTSVGLTEFSSSEARTAAANVCAPLPPNRMPIFAAIRTSQLQPTKIESAVREARASVTE